MASSQFIVQLVFLVLVFILEFVEAVEVFCLVMNVRDFHAMENFFTHSVVNSGGLKGVLGSCFMVDNMRSKNITSYHGVRQMKTKMKAQISLSSSGTVPITTAAFMFLNIQETLLGKLEWRWEIAFIFVKMNTRISSSTSPSEWFRLTSTRCQTLLIPTTKTKNSCCHANASTTAINNIKTTNATYSVDQEKNINPTVDNTNNTTLISIYIPSTKPELKKMRVLQRGCYNNTRNKY